MRRESEGCDVASSGVILSGYGEQVEKKEDEKWSKEIKEETGKKTKNELYKEEERK
jgi:hypothetical protein